MIEKRHIPLDLYESEDRRHTAKALERATDVELDKENPDKEKLKELNRLTHLILNQSLDEADHEVSREKQRAEKASRDTLTGLYDRAALEEFVYPRLAESSPDDSFFALYCDVKDLGGVNNNNGHDQGDLLILSTVESLTISTGANSELDDQKFGVSEEFVVMRFGGDEFVIVGAGDESVAHKLALIIEKNHGLAMRGNKELRPDSYRGIKFGYAALKVNDKNGLKIALRDADPKKNLKFSFNLE